MRTAFRCPTCRRPTLHIQATMTFPPDARDDDIGLQTLLCDTCGFRGLAVYRESRRGAPFEETWEHEGYRVPFEDWQRVTDWIRSCPQPRRRDCDCAAHRRLGQRDDHGRVDGLRLSGVRILEIFPMHLEKGDAS